MDNYNEILDAARLVAENQFYLAESLLRGIPPRSAGRHPAGDTTPTVEASLKNVADLIRDEVGIDYSVDYLRTMRNVAAWASANQGGNPPSFRWVTSSTWDAHYKAFRKGITWDEFAAGTRAQPVGWAVPEEDRREAIRAQAEEDGTGPAKAVDIASNTKAMQAAIKADPKTAEAARKALETHDKNRHDKIVREHGGDPDMPMDDLGIDRAAVECRRLIAAINATAADVRGLHRRSEPGQWVAFQAALAQAAEGLNLSIQGIKVPDSLEGIEL
jgi:hypothetical protein